MRLGSTKSSRRERLRRLGPRHLSDEVARRLQRSGRERVGHQRVARGVGSTCRVCAPAKPDGQRAATDSAAIDEESKDASVRLEPLKSVFQEDPNRVEAVAPADLFAARAVARIEFDWPLDDAASLAQQLRRDLRLDVEAVRLELKTARRRAA